jgi:3-deoxy-manno-octulosonate cytidylyltransferase (CMP-KDO synthetase)
LKDVLVVIPARYGSKRLPGKPLLRETGRFLIQHVWEAARKSRLAGRVVVATDDRRILDAVRGFGGEAVMTSKHHKSGTDRAAEVARKCRADLIVNVQGDEPDLPARHIDRLIRLFEDEGVEMATLACRAEDTEETLANPNVVKVVTDKEGYALYFSRAGIPFERDHAAGVARTVLRHIGIYGYTRETLLRLVRTPQSALERTEKLEQLRALENGVRISVGIVRGFPPGIDTEEQYREFVARCRGKG